MAADEVQPEGKSETPSDRKSRLDEGTWMGIVSIVIDLPAAAVTVAVMPAILRGDWGYEETGALLCLPPSALVGALVAVLGTVLARKQKSKRGLQWSAAGLILALVLFFAFALGWWATS
jgi:hypothetical protein